jgi:AcrR family transcriptional regulator
MESNHALIAAYKRLALEKGILPVSKKEIAHAAGLEVEDFLTAFPSLEALQEVVWVQYLRETLEALETSEAYASYSVREKMLAYYFTFFEQLEAEREFVQLFEPKMGVWNYNPTFLIAFKKAFLAFVEELIKEGLETQEIAERLMLGSEYGGWHWPQMLFLLNKWIEDKSEAHALSDEAIEKAVNLGFDIMGRNVLDSAFDFGKFILSKG